MRLKAAEPKRPAAPPKVYRRALYSRLAQYYDNIYWWKDYEKEVAFLDNLFRENGLAGGRVLEVACGTGNHTKILTRLGYAVTGVDISDDVLKVAKRKAPSVTFVKGDMRNLDLAVSGEFEAVVCLFSAISYNRTLKDLRLALQGFHRHLRKGGVVVFDTHFTRRGFWDGHRGEDIFDDGNIFGARLSLSTKKGTQGRIVFSYLIKDGRKVTVLRNDVHELGLFEPEEFLSAMSHAGFSRVRHLKDWTTKKTGRSHAEKEHVFVGVKE